MEPNFPPATTPTAGTTSTTQQRFVVLSQCLQQRVIGQKALVERLLIALLADGHLLVDFNALPTS